ncbi:hypothetical protein Taro_018231 [Colocasia esculenta]|uniref:Uncharacterized protein n=1 Tax=Colocasia esculenta TaxID=4460 RepID=A0A843V1U6_COLES|nr:hypothetical protein [Colocasia esculenta]
MATAWDNEEATISESSSSDSEKEQERVLELSRVVWRRFWQRGKQEIPTPSRSSSPVSSAATCTDHHLEVDQRATSVDTACASVDLLSQNSPEGVMGRSLVSTLPDQFCPKGDYDVQEEEPVEDGNASE